MNRMQQALAALCLALPLAALAQTATPHIDQRQARQQARIEQGVHSGSLTPREAARLERGQARVARMENRAKADGVVTAGERAHVRQAENRQSREIRQQKHDRQHDANHDGRVDRVQRRP